ncbi:MAG: hypothetical protein ACLFV0_12800, partial [Nitriliruptoraceae bacterium]
MSGQPDPFRDAEAWLAERGVLREPVTRPGAPPLPAEPHAAGPHAAETHAAETHAAETHAAETHAAG